MTKRKTMKPKGISRKRVKVPDYLADEYLPQKLGMTPGEYMTDPEYNGLKKRCVRDLRVYDKKTMPTMAFRYCLVGASNHELSLMFGVEERTICYWLKNYTDFGEAVERGRLVADSDVADALLTRAKGYDRYIDKAYVVDGKIEIVQLRQHIPADVTAAKFWLTNRQKDKWQSVPDIAIDNMQVYAPVIKRFDGSVDDIDAVAMVRGMDAAAEVPLEVELDSDISDGSGYVEPSVEGIADEYDDSGKYDEYKEEK